MLAEVIKSISKTEGKEAQQQAAELVRRGVTEAETKRREILARAEDDPTRKSSQSWSVPRCTWSSSGKKPWPSPGPQLSIGPVFSVLRHRLPGRYSFLPTTPRPGPCHERHERALLHARWDHHRCRYHGHHAHWRPYLQPGNQHPWSIRPFQPPAVPGIFQLLLRKGRTTL